MQDDPFISTNVLRSLIWMINSKYASQYNQMICYLCYYWNTRWVLETRPVPGGYGYKILPARLRGYRYMPYSFGYCRGRVFAIPAPYPTRCHLCVFTWMITCCLHGIPPGQVLWLVWSFASSTTLHIPCKLLYVQCILLLTALMYCLSLVIYSLSSVPPRFS